MTFPSDLDLTAVDISVPIAQHWRFSPELQYGGSEEGGISFHTTSLAMPAHSFTHVDAPWHVDQNGRRIGDIELRELWGAGTVIDVSDLGDDALISSAQLGARCATAPNEIILIRSDHALRHPFDSVEYWTRAPFVDRSGAEWLLATGAKAVGFDFPQDRAIRQQYLPDFVPSPDGAAEDLACHFLLGRAGVHQAEYLTNLGALPSEGFLVFLFPINLSEADGAPARAFALVPSAARRA